MRNDQWHPLIDYKKQQIARRYHNEHLVLSLISTGVLIIIIIAIIKLQISQKVFESITGLTSSRFLQVFFYFTFFYLFYSIIILPFSYIGGFKIEHKYNFSTQTLKAWFCDVIKSFFVGWVLGVLIIEVLYAITFYAPDMWWLYFSLIMIAFSVVLSNLAPILILPLFYKTMPVPDGDLKNRIKEICERVDINIEGVYTINLSSRSNKANAAVVGLGNTKKILLGDTLLTKYDENEILVTLAHEITHYQEHHIWYLILWQSIITLIMFYLFYRLQDYLYHWAGFNNVSDIAAFPVFVLVFSILIFVFKPLGAAISRYYEKKADYGALILTKNPEYFISLMAKFCNEELVLAYPNPLIEFYHYSHPSPGKRIAFAEEFMKRAQDA
ncbi:MAG: M48 family metallopeptidase [bacterium]